MLTLKQSRRLNTLVVGLFAWAVALLLFFPIFWMVLTSFKSEVEAIRPGLVFAPTLESYAEVRARAEYLRFALNSVVVSLGGTLLGLAFAVPAAYSMAFHPTERTRGTLLWMLSTKMLPPVGVLVPIYLMFRTLGALDTRWGLVAIYALMNLPILVWMLFTFFKEVPKEILEAGRMDGARTGGEFWHLLLPLTLPGIAGIVLTMGMAVDANVLIFSRIREEIANGMSIQRAIHEGFDRAYSAILDSNLTTLLVGGILFAMGTGPVKGFAVTLSLGIITSMFTAIMFTRGLVNLIFGGRNFKKLWI